MEILESSGTRTVLLRDLAESTGARLDMAQLATSGAPIGEPSFGETNLSKSGAGFEADSSRLPTQPVTSVAGTGGVPAALPARPRSATLREDNERTRPQPPSRPPAALTASCVLPHLIASGHQDGSVRLCYFLPDAHGASMRAVTETLSAADISGIPVLPLPALKRKASWVSPGSLASSPASTATTAVAPNAVASAVTALHVVPLFVNAEPPNPPHYLLAVATADRVYLRQVRCEAAAAATTQLAATLHSAHDGLTGAPPCLRAALLPEELQKAVRRVFEGRKAQGEPTPSEPGTVSHPGQPRRPGSASPKDAHHTERSAVGKQPTPSLPLSAQEPPEEMIFTVEDVTLSRCGQFLAVHALRPGGGGGGAVLVYRVPPVLVQVPSGRAARGVVAAAAEAPESSLTLGDVVVGTCYVPPVSTYVLSTAGQAAPVGGASSGAASPASGSHRCSSANRNGSAFSRVPSVAGATHSLSRPLCKARCVFLYERGPDVPATTLFTAWLHSCIYARLPLTMGGGGPLLPRLTEAVTTTCMATPCLAALASARSPSGRPRSGGARHTSLQATVTKEKDSATAVAARAVPRRSSRGGSARRTFAENTAPSQETVAYAMHALCGSEVALKAAPALSGVQHGRTPTPIQALNVVEGLATLVVLGCEGGTIMLLERQRLAAVGAVLPPPSHLRSLLPATQLRSGNPAFPMSVTALRAVSLPGEEGGAASVRVTAGFTISSAVAVTAITTTTAPLLPFLAAATTASASSLHGVTSLILPLAGGPHTGGPAPRRECLVALPGPVQTVTDLAPFPLVLLSCAVEAAGGDEGPTALLWDVACNGVVATLSDGGSPAVAPLVSPDGSMVTLLRATKGEAVPRPSCVARPGGSAGSGRGARRHSSKTGGSAAVTAAAPAGGAVEATMPLTIHVPATAAAAMPSSPLTPFIALGAPATLTPCVVPVLALLRAVHPLLFSFLSPAAPLCDGKDGQGQQVLAYWARVLSHIPIADRSTLASLRPHTGPASPVSRTPVRAPPRTDVPMISLGRGPGFLVRAPMAAAEPPRGEGEVHGLRSLTSLAGRAPVSRMPRTRHLVK